MGTALSEHSVLGSFPGLGCVAVTSAHSLARFRTNNGLSYLPEARGYHAQWHVLHDERLLAHRATFLRQMKKLFLNAPEGVSIRRHEVADNDVRFTVPNLLGGRKLVGWAKNGRFVWICKGYSA